jgi:hypothetical protein
MSFTASLLGQRGTPKGNARPPTACRTAWSRGRATISQGAGARRTGGVPPRARQEPRVPAATSRDRPRWYNRRLHRSTRTASRGLAGVSGEAAASVGASPSRLPSPMAVVWVSRRHLISTQWRWASGRTLVRSTRQPGTWYPAYSNPSPVHTSNGRTRCSDCTLARSNGTGLSRTAGRSGTGTQGGGAFRLHCHPHIPSGCPGRPRCRHSCMSNRTFAPRRDRRYRYCRCRWRRGSRTETRSGRCRHLAQPRRRRRGNQCGPDTDRHRWSPPSTITPRLGRVQVL